MEERGTGSAEAVRAPRSGVLLALGAGIVLAALAGLLASFRVAGLVLAAVLAGAALARLLLPVGAAGPLAVRSRVTDVTTSGLLALGVAVLALTAPGGG